MYSFYSQYTSKSRLLVDGIPPVWFTVRMRSLLVRKSVMRQPLLDHSGI